MSSYVWVQFLRSKDPAKVDELGKWLADCELPVLFDHSAVKQASLYKNVHYSDKLLFSGHQPDYYTLYRFEARDYETIRRGVIELFEKKVLRNSAPDFLERERKLFYEENHKCSRVEPRIPAYDSAFAGPKFQKYAIYGFSHSADEKRREEFITWYQVVRQHDVLRDFSPFDNARMWLLCPGETYPEYVFTLYEFSPSDITRAIDVNAGGYAVINWLRGSDLYVSGYSGLLMVTAELFKEY